MSSPQAILRIFTNSNISEAYFLKKLSLKGWVSGANKMRGSEVERGGCQGLIKGRVVK